MAVSTGGTQIIVWRDTKERKQESLFESLCFCLPNVRNKKFAKETTMPTLLLSFLVALQDELEAYLDGSDLRIHTEHKRNKQIFCGHPNFRGTGPWQDWVVIDWGRDHGHLPAHIACFVELDGIPDKSRVHFGDTELKDGVYAVVETAFYSQDKDAMDYSELLKPIYKEVQTTDDGNIKRYEDTNAVACKFLLADVEAIVETCCVVPNIGGAENEYFMVKQRPEWVQSFVDWLEDNHEDFREDELKLQGLMNELAQKQAEDKQAEKDAANAVKQQRKEEEKEARKRKREEEREAKRVAKEAERQRKKRREKIGDTGSAFCGSWCLKRLLWNQFVSCGR